MMARSFVTNFIKSLLTFKAVQASSFYFAIKCRNRWYIVPSDLECSAFKHLLRFASIKFIKGECTVGTNSMTSQNITNFNISFFKVELNMIIFFSYEKINLHISITAIVLK
jgi:hypothetical protein